MSASLFQSGQDYEKQDTSIKGLTGGITRGDLRKGGVMSDYISQSKMSPAQELVYQQIEGTGKFAYKSKKEGGQGVFESLKKWSANNPAVQQALAQERSERTGAFQAGQARSGQASANVFNTTQSRYSPNPAQTINF